MSHSARANRHVSVLDQFALVEFEHLLGGNDHRVNSAFGHLQELLKCGSLFYPRSVVDSLQRYSGRSGPAFLWARQNVAVRCLPDPPEKVLRSILRKAKNLVDYDSQWDDAKPYVLASARHLIELGYDAVVVTSDFMPKPDPQISLAAACRMVDVAWIPPEKFLLRCGIDVP